MSEFFEMQTPLRVVVGTIGEPGQRAFFLQAREAASLVTMKIEKQQVAALAVHLGQLLQDLPRPGELPGEDDRDLEDFGDADFVVGTLSVAYDSNSERIMLLIEGRAGDDEDPDEARNVLSLEQAASLAIHGTTLVESGRPPCPLCGYPLDPRDHACPKTNGHHPPRL